MLTKNEVTIKEVLELVQFTRDENGKLCVSNVVGNVEGNVWGSVGGNVKGSVKCTDLTKNTTPFCLLSKEDQERLKSWPHGLEYFSLPQKTWLVCTPTPAFALRLVYRTRPAPIETTQTIDGMEFKITYEEGGTNPKIERKESK